MSSARLTPWAAALLLLLVAVRPAVVQASSLEDYIRLRQSLARSPSAPAREELERRTERLRGELLVVAARSSRVIVLNEQQRGYEAEGRRQVVRLVGRDGRATVEALSAGGAESSRWERSGALEPAAYLGLVRRLLDELALLDDLPDQRFDPNAPGPRRAVAVTVVIGEEAREAAALWGTPYERLSAVVAAVVEFAHSIPLLP